MKTTTVEKTKAAVRPKKALADTKKAVVKKGVVKAKPDAANASG